MNDPLSNVLDKLDNVKRTGSGYSARCPAHDDRKNSLSIHLADNGSVLLYCHAQCPSEHVLDVLGLHMSDLFPRVGARSNASSGSAKRETGTSRGRIDATYDYRDEHGELLFQAIRYDPKGFSQRRPNERGGWISNLDGVRRVLYRLPELREADPARWVLVVEGEKDCDRLAELKFVATTSPQGAGKWREEYSEALRGRRVAILPDNDDAGAQHAEGVAQSLSGIAAKVCVVRLPDLPVKGDVSDWLDAGGTAEALKAHIKDAPIWPPIAKTVAADGDSGAGAGCDVPVFPLDVLPPKVRAYVQAAADSLDVPAEMVAVPLLGLAGALMGNRLHLTLKNSWREYPTLYLAVVAPPGSAKSPALNLAKWPLDALQEAAHERHAQQLAEYDAEHARWKAKGKKHGEPEPIKPRLRHYFSTAPTIEGLGAVLDDAPGVAVIRDEISGWVAAMDQYRGGKGSDRQQYLSLWSGQAIKVDLKGGGSLYVPEPVSCVVGGIQPDLAGTLHTPSQRRDGFVERVLPVVPNVGAARWSDAAPSTEQYGDVLAVFKALDAIAYPRAGAETELSRGHGVNLSREARAAFIAWHEDNGGLVDAAEGLAEGFYSKLPAHVARLALILHALWHLDDPRVMVSGERMQDAIELGEFFRSHIGRFLALLQASAPAGSAGLDARIVRIVRTANEVDGWVARSTIYRRLRNVPAEALSDALDRMSTVGVIERRTSPTATRPIEEYRFAHSQDSHYSQSSSTPAPETGLSRATQGNNANNANDAAWLDELEESRESTTPEQTPMRRPPVDDEWVGGEEGIL